MLNKVINRRFILGVFLLSTILLFSSCSLNRVFGLKKDEFIYKIKNKDYAFLTEVDYLKNSLKEINRLDDGASYYMSFVYKANNMLLFSNKLLYQELQNKHSYYGPKAASQLIKQLLQERDYIKAEAQALDFFDNYKVEDSGIRKQLIEAMYWQKKDDQVIPFIDNLDRTLYSDYANYELDMLRSVSSARLNREGWEDSYKALFFNQPLSPLLKRAYSFIDVYPDYGKGFTSEEKTLFKALALASGGDYYNSQLLLRPLMEDVDWIFSTNQLIKNISKIIKTSRVITLNLEAFETAMNNSPNELYDDALVSYASLYFNIENFTSVVNLLEDKLGGMSIGNTKDDGLWLYLLSLSHVEEDRVVSQMKYHFDTLSGDNYSSDIIDHVLTALIQNSEWQFVKEMKPIVEKYGDTTDNSRILWVLSRLYYHEFIEVDNITKSIEEALDEIVISDDSSYYSYMANALLKRESNLVLREPKEPLPLNDDDRWILGFLEYGLEDEALSFSKQIKDLNYNVAIDVAKRLDIEEKHLENLRFMSGAKVPLNTESFPLYYPLPYKEKIVEIAAKYNFPATLFSGLIRTESGFDMYVVSSAGAVGLSQLMPGTALEQATDLGMGTPDLNDPDTNILLGGTYVDWLIDRFQTLPVSFMAYNAGPGNVWQWQRGWGDLPDELFIEAAPFKETRNYVPKILSAAIYYGHEEYDTSPYDVIKSLFPDID